MKHLLLSIISLAAIAALLFTGCDSDTITQQDNIPPPISQTAPPNGSAVKADSTEHNRYIVMFKEQPAGLADSRAAQVAVEKTNTIFSALALSQDSLIHQYKTASFGFAGHFSPEQADQLRSHPLVDHVVKDYYYKAIDVVSNITSPVMNNLFAFASQTTPWGVNRINGPLNGTGKTAWVLDSGVDLNHPDLNVDLSRTVSFLSNEGTDDLNGHGTHVSGIIGAVDNSRDVVGVAAGASIVGVKVCDSGGGCFVSDVKAGVEYAANNFSSGDVANLSLGYPTGISIPSIDIPLSNMESSIINAANSGLKFTISAGNSSQNANNFSPARIENTNVWTVSAFDINDNFAFFSNYGNPPIEYGGPGVNILSLWKNGGTNTIDGTSMSAPHIAGLLLAAPNDITTDGVVSNDPDGDPDPIAVYNPFTVPGFSVSISGPSRIYKGETVTWTADASGGSSPYSYKWYYTYTECAPESSDCSDEGVTYFGGTGDSFSLSYTSNYDKVRIEVVAKDNTGDTASDLKDVLIEDIAK